MGLIEHRLMDINRELEDLRGAFKDGKMPRPEYLRFKIALLSQEEKRTRQMLDAHALEAKHNGRYKAMRHLMASNLLGDGSTIDVSPVNAELEKIKCPQRGGKIITRSECLSWSGDTNHFDGCESCDHFSVTRQRLLPKE